MIGFALEFQYEDFYAGIPAGNQLFHLKLVDEKDPSIKFADDVEAAAAAFRKRGIRFTTDIYETPWGTKEFAVKDNQGHTLYFGGSR